MSRGRVDVVTDDDALARLEGEWGALLARTPLGSGFQSFAWTAACRAHLPSRRPLHVLVVRDAGEVIGILPSELGPAGDLCLIGQPVTNYQGPVYDPARVHDVAAVLADYLSGARVPIRLLDFQGLREGSPFLAAWSTADLARWDAPRILQTASCPFIDLTMGWDAIYRRKGSTARTQDARKWRGLARLGRVEFVEMGDPADVRAALPEMFRVFQGRWAGRRESGGFAGRFRRFHEQAAPRLAAAGHVRVSLLKLDGHVVGFYYGIVAQSAVSGYVTAHDATLGACSPGWLLMIRMLEAACARGDTAHDFSLGEERYKTQLATGAAGVCRMLRWRTASRGAFAGSLRALRNRAWVAARSVDWMRELKREGLRRQLLGRRPSAVLRDRPGLAARPSRSWTVYRVPTPIAGRPTVDRATWGYDEMRRVLAPRLLETAVDRSFRNDVLVVVREGDRPIGIVWRCCANRRTLVLGGCADDCAKPLYYEPIALDGHAVTDVVRALASVEQDADELLLVARETALPPVLARRLGSFTGDTRFAPPNARVPAIAAAGLAAVKAAVDVGNLSEQ